MARLAPLRLSGSTALVTGAGSGIGEQLARALARRGVALVLLDRDAAALERVAADLRAGTHAEVDARVVDLAVPRERAAMVGQLVADHPSLNLLLNVAGAALVGRFAELTTAEFDWLLETNLRAPIALVRGLLPVLVRNQDAHVVNVSSVFGLLGVYGQSAYATSKFGLRGFSESLLHELGELGVGVTTVLPGGVRTKITEHARIGDRVDTGRVRQQIAAFEPLLRMPPERAADKIVAAMIARRARLVLGSDARLLDGLVRLAPTRFPRALNAVGRRQARRWES